MSVQALKLKDRGIIKLSGSEAKSFLNGLITNDVNTVSEDQAIYAGMLTPQGKYLFDFIVAQQNDDLYIDCEASKAADLWRKLMMYKLRADVEITDVSDQYRIWALFGEGEVTGITYQDPRHWKMGKRAIVAKGHNLLLPDDGSEACDPLKLEHFETERLMLGIPDASRDIMVDKNFWLECRAEDLNGVNFNKGCYVGQEQTARMKHRTSLKKSLLPMRVEGGAPEYGTDIVTAEGKKIGDIRSSQGDLAIGFIRLEHREADLFTDGKKITLL